jgi:hypothetical protein
MKFTDEARTRVMESKKQREAQPAAARAETK